MEKTFRGFQLWTSSLFARHAVSSWPNLLPHGPIKTALHGKRHAEYSMRNPGVRGAGNLGKPTLRQGSGYVERGSDRVHSSVWVPSILRRKQRGENNLLSSNVGAST